MQSGKDGRRQSVYAVRGFLGNAKRGWISEANLGQGRRQSNLEKNL